MISKDTAYILANMYQRKFSDAFSYKDFMNRHLLYRNPPSEVLEFFQLNDYGFDFLQLINTKNTQKKFKAFIEELHNNTQIGQKYLKKLAEDIIDVSIDSEVPELKVGCRDLISSLGTDGYSYRNKKLFFSEGSDINYLSRQVTVENLVDCLDLKYPQIIKRHLEKCYVFYEQKQWEESIVNARKFFEDILRQVANGINNKNTGSDLSPQIYSKAVRVRLFLESENFVNRKEVETFEKVYALLSDMGAHPNPKVINKNQARLMRSLALALSQYVLLSYDDFMKSDQDTASDPEIAG